MRKADKRTKANMDPEQWAAHLERKRAERKNRPGYEAKRKANWRASNPASNRKLRLAHWAVENAIRDGNLIRPAACSHCGKACRPEAHHDSYERQDRLKVRWLCVSCHAEADGRCVHKGE